MLNCKINHVCEPSCQLTQSERKLYYYWINQLFPLDHLKTSCGKTLSILSAGQRNELEGPDFHNARIFIDDKYLEGSIEMHIKSEDWYSHKHEQDPNYNNVILHVVSQNNPNIEIKTLAKNKIPTFILDTKYKNLPENKFKCENWKNFSWEEAKETINHYAAIRFQRKCIKSRDFLLKTDAEQYYYAGLFDVFGFSQNREAFVLLAKYLPISLIYKILKETSPDQQIPTLEAIYFGTAGFLTNKKYSRFLTNPQYLQGLNRRWKKISNKYSMTEYNDLKFHFAGSRPSNHPTRRIAALTQIIGKTYPAFPGQIWINQIISGKSIDQILIWAENTFQQPEGLWKSHPLFSFQPGKVLVGKERLLDLFSNHLLPFAWAIGSVKKNKLLMDNATEIAKRIPKAAIYSQISKFLSRLSINASKIDTNYINQGVLEFIHKFCSLNICNLCPLEKYANHK